MTDLEHISEELSRKIEDIQKDVLTGRLSLLDLELAPFFTELKDSLNMKNINKYSKIYANACELLDEKFENLRALLASLNDENKFFEYLKSAPEDLEIYQLFRKCSRIEYVIDSLSIEFLKRSKAILCREKPEPYILEHLDKIAHKQEFLVEMPKQQFTDKMMKYFKEIQNKLPCSFDFLFEEIQNQDRIYEHFVYILHLLQMGKVKYQKQTNTLYI